MRQEGNQKGSVLKTERNDYVENKKSGCQILLRIDGHKNLFGVDSGKRGAEETETISITPL